MTRPRNESALELLAVQLESINANYPEKTPLQRFMYRLNREFFNKGFRDKSAFLKSIAVRLVEKVVERLPAIRRRTDGPRVPGDRLRVAAVCNGGLGDLIIYGGFLDRFYRECGGQVAIEAIVHRPRLSEAEFVFHDSPSVAAVVSNVDTNPATTAYDIVIRLGDLLSYEFVREEAVDRHAPRMLPRLRAACATQQRYRRFIDRQPTLDGLFATWAARSGLKRLDVLGWMGHVDYTQRHMLPVAPDPATHARLISFAQLHNKRYVTIHNGWDNVAHRHSQNVTKAWPIDSYIRCVELLKQKFPSLPVVQLGARTSQPIPNVDLCLLNDTTLHEAAWILKHSALHIDGDSGLVHLARALHATSLVLFGPTNHEFFEYAENLKLYSTNCNNCWWVTHDWMRTCPRGMAEPECMKSIRPETVAEMVEEHLHSLRAIELRAEAVEGGAQSSIGCVSEALALCDRSSGAGHRLAVLGAADAATPPTLPAGWALRAFRFRNRTGCRRAGEPNIAGEVDQTADFGSIYNLPAEAGEFDAVLFPDGERLEFPFYALKESLRILKDGGVLIVRRSAAGNRPLCTALEELGLGRPSFATAGVTVVRKTPGASLFASPRGLRIVHRPHEFHPSAGGRSDRESPAAFPRGS